MVKLKNILDACDMRIKSYKLKKADYEYTMNPQIFMTLFNNNVYNKKRCRKKESNSIKSIRQKIS